MKAPHLNGCPCRQCEAVQIAEEKLSEAATAWADEKLFELLPQAFLEQLPGEHLDRLEAALTDVAFAYLEWEADRV